MPTDSDFEEAFAAVLPDADGPFVPGVGPLDATVMVVGEAPGAEEIEQGEPFVGNAGRRLDAFLEAAGIDREACYLTNVVKVRPPENRAPRVGEVRDWRPVLAAELERVDPAVVVTLGNAATRALLDSDEGITRLRGRTYERDGRVVVPTFHPAATFYDESKREAIAADLATAAEAIARRG